MQRVSDVMTRQVQPVSPRDSLRHAARMMDELNVGALPVCDGERLVGMVTDRDITVRATSAGLAPDDTTVEQVMSADARICHEDQSIDEVIRQMEDTQIRRVPVMSRDDPPRLIGIVSLGDIATRQESGVQAAQVQQVVEKVSFPSEPDLSSKGMAPGSAGAAPGTGADAGAGGSDTGTATGMAGSDIVDDRLNPRYEVSATADPSDIVEVTPADLVNRNAPGSTELRNPTTAANAASADRAPVVTRRTGDHEAGTADAPGASGGTAGTAGTAGSAGTGVGAKP
ncbi:CBS domain-containing protein|uniref:CBS domain-containing protein n=1 Tax=Noviherbaspirillum sp. L7-7A TaxID=2850560 RepID=UPI001C2C87D8|nr:CBS domain-containing protein [Noviherbaspirillum sp. L7-7A]MBV0878705.1 CBS domain-containing protein [Noviherbaspirillum sp. L7-7A]